MMSYLDCYWYSAASSGLAMLPAGLSAIAILWMQTTLWQSRRARQGHSLENRQRPFFLSRSDRQSTWWVFGTIHLSCRQIQWFHKVLTFRASLWSKSYCYPHLQLCILTTNLLAWTQQSVTGKCLFPLQLSIIGRELITKHGSRLFRKPVLWGDIRSDPLVTIAYDTILNLGWVSRTLTNERSDSNKKCMSQEAY